MRSASSADLNTPPLKSTAVGAIGAGADFLGALAALRAELGGFTLTLGLHAAIDLFGDLARQVRTSARLNRPYTNPSHPGQTAALPKRGA